tara:strand:+ start:559 stop:711 length:153 start_codon:yes stop_codon:yes gene_type:complete
MSSKHGAGKGDRYRTVDQKKWDEGWEAAFGKKKPKQKSKNKETKDGRNRN